MKRQGFAGFLRRKQYVIAGAIVVIAAVGMTVLYSSEQERARQQLEAEIAEELNQQQPEEVAVAEDTEDAAEASAVIPPEPAVVAESVQIEESIEVAEVEDETETEEQTVTETTASREKLHFSPEEGLLWPLEGNVIINYSADETVYFATLDQYKTNPAVIISGKVNDKIYSVARGQVINISTNEETGCTMTVDLGDGYQAIYGQIKEPNFSVGDYVESGHVLGFVAEPTKYYSVEGSNLYFALKKDGAPVDPVEYFE